MQTVVFDVNETLLDLQALDPHFDRLFGDSSVRSIWFSQVLQTALVCTILGDYKPFGEVAQDALQAVAAKHQTELAAEDLQAIGTQMRNLPPHADVIPNLKRLREHGFTVVALTNSDQQMANTQLSNAGIADLFHHILSVESVAQFKPQADVYQIVVDRLSIAKESVWFVAAHDWDIAGAMAYGFKGAYVIRGLGEPHPAYPQPDFVGRNLSEIIDHIQQSVV